MEGCGHGFGHRVVYPNMWKSVPMVLVTESCILTHGRVFPWLWSLLMQQLVEKYAAEAPFSHITSVVLDLYNLNIY